MRLVFVALFAVCVAGAVSSLNEQRRFRAREIYERYRRSTRENADRYNDRAPFTLNARKDGCGHKDSIKTAERGMIRSPYYPQDYPIRSLCSWRIVAAADQRIRLRFHKNFELEQGPDCLFDSLEIRDGPSVRAPLIGSYCGTTRPKTIVSTGNTLHLIFYSDGSVTAVGFRGFFTTEPNPNAAGTPAPSPSPAPTKAPGPITQTPAPTKPTTGNGECGRPSNGSKSHRVVGGTTAVPGAWPWQVMLLRNNFAICGGVIIDKQWVLTAAHCVIDRNNNAYPASAFKIIVGNHDRYMGDPFEKTHTISQVIKHSYPSSSSVAGNDIALLKVERDITFNAGVQAVCLPDTEVPTGQNCVTTGWGDTKDTGSNRYLREVTVPVISQSECRGYYGSSRVKNDMVCAGLKRGGKDSCQGDSGGPLVCDVDNDGRWHLLGLVSWGVGCALEEKPGVYAKVKYHLSWIKSNSGVTNE